MHHFGFLVNTRCVCEFAMMAGVYILLCPQEEKYSLLPTYSATQSPKRFKPLSVTILLYKFIFELEKNISNKKRLTAHGACRPSSTLKFFFLFQIMS